MRLHYFLSFFVLGCISSLPFQLCAATATVVTSSGLSAEVEPGTGRYSVACKQPDWRLGGGFNHPVENVLTGKGRDKQGDYHEVTFNWKEGARPMSGTIRLYDDHPVALLSQTCREASETPPPAFPAFTNLPADLHVFSYGWHEFAPPRFSATEISTPWMLFDDKANAVVISPATHFMVARMIGDGRTNVTSGFATNLHNLPAGFTHTTAVVMETGINRAWELWGKTLLALGDAKRPGPEADPVLRYLGYWTDNGANYYYNYDMDKGYAGTMLALAEHYRQEQIPIRYLQLDSWWYYKTTTDADGKPGKPIKAPKLPPGEWNRYGGLLEYKAHTDLFTNGLDNFQKAIGLPLVTHSRWVDRESPYHQRYKISGVAAVDPKWWDEIATYMKSVGIVTYEQDWLDRIFTYSPAFSGEIGVGEAFLDNMSRACQEKGITLQYCMPYPCHFMQGSRYENLTTIRTSGDRFHSGHWGDFLYTSRLASALGIRPWADVYMSPETNNVLVSTLSAGAVGIGDAIGKENKANLLLAVRPDGVIVKPDAPMVPLDRTYIADAKKKHSPFMAATYTENNGLRTSYVFAFNRSGSAPGEVKASRADLGLNGDAYVYDYFAASGKPLPENESLTAPLAEKAAAFYVVAPMRQSGIAFLGDKGKFVGTGRQRIAAIEEARHKLTVNLLLAENEDTVTLHGFAKAAPSATILAGVDDPVQYDPTTHYFTMEIKGDRHAPLDRRGPDPVREVTVILETPK